MTWNSSSHSNWPLLRVQLWGRWYCNQSWWQLSVKKQLNFLGYYRKPLLKLSVINMVSPCCMFCPLPSCERGFNDSFSPTNFSKRSPAGKPLDCITRHRRWQVESCNWELLHTLRIVKCYCMASFQKQSTSLP